MHGIGNTKNTEWQGLCLLKNKAKEKILTLMQNLHRRRTFLTVTKNVGEVEKKLSQSTAGFLGKHMEN